ncbi:MAG: cytochrome C oxidase subunit IV family protein [Planctomycetota bacterium]
MTAHDHANAAATAHGHDAHGHGDHAHGGWGPHHVTSTKTFVNVLLALLFLTFVTVAASRFDFGSANLLIAMLIASVKASLVIAIFMHVKWDTAINKIVFLSSFLFLSLLLIFTLSDQATRGRANAANKIKAPVDREFVHPSLRGSNQ